MTAHPMVLPLSVENIPFPWQVAQWQTVQTSLRQGKLPHALLLTGAAGLGKQLFAQALAGILLCQMSASQQQACGQCKSCLLLKAGTHPDYYTVVPDEPQAAIKIDQVRQLSELVQQTPQIAERQVVLIYPAEALNTASANALLKTLEEPSGDIVFLLVAHLPKLLLATIKSRCQPVHFMPPSQQNLLSWLELHAETPQAMDYAVAFSENLPLRALALCQTEDLTQSKVLFDGLSAWMSGAQSLVDTAQRWSKQPLLLVLDQLLICLFAIIRWDTAKHSNIIVEALQPTLAKFNLIEAFALVDKLYKSRQMLYQRHALNAQLLLEDVLYHWQRALMRGES